MMCMSIKIAHMNVRSVHINFKKRDGSIQQVEAKTGMSLLQVAHANDIDLEGMQGHACMRLIIYDEELIARANALCRRL